MLLKLIHFKFKYKEDDFSDSNCRSLFSRCLRTQDLFPPRSAHMSNPASSPPPFYRSQPWQSAMKTQDINNPVSTLAPPWWWFRYRTNNRRHCLHLAPRSTKFQRSGRNQTSFHYPVYRISPQSLPPTGEGNNSSLRNVPEIRAEPDFLPLSCIQDKSAISLP